MGSSADTSPAGTDEVNKRDLKIVRCPKRSIVGLVNRTSAIVIEKAVRRLYVAVWRIRGSLNRQRRGASLDGGTEDSFLRA